MGRHIRSGPQVGHWVAEQMDGVFSPHSMTAIGLWNGNKPIAGVMYENWNGRSVVAHCAVTGRINRQFLACIFDYAFRQLACEKVICPIASTNTKSIHFCANLGFREEARIKDAAPNGDVLLYTLNRDNCRFLGSRYGEAIRTSSA